MGRHIQYETHATLKGHADEHGSVLGVMCAQEGLGGMFGAFIHLYSVSVLSSGHGRCGVECYLYFVKKEIFGGN